ncbi:hypothetical protein AGMMS49992_09130 [Clostridia bacterium]|nr:hypothetical protein AGMMS49992_09130 [Clostridia bacterium]
MNLESATQDSYIFIRKYIDYDEITPKRALIGLFIAEMNTIISMKHDETSVEHMARLANISIVYNKYFRSDIVSQSNVFCL